jgi:hypothetical protein
MNSFFRGIEKFFSALFQAILKILSFLFLDKLVIILILLPISGLIWIFRLANKDNLPATIVSTILILAFFACVLITIFLGLRKIFYYPIKHLLKGKYTIAEITSVERRYRNKFYYYVHCNFTDTEPTELSKTQKTPSKINRTVRVSRRFYNRLAPKKAPIFKFKSEKTYIPDTTQTLKYPLYVLVRYTKNGTDYNLKFKRGFY